MSHINDYHPRRLSEEKKNMYHNCYWEVSEDLMDENILTLYLMKRQNHSRPDKVVGKLRFNVIEKSVDEAADEISEQYESDYIKERMQKVKSIFKEVDKINDSNILYRILFPKKLY